MHVHPYDAPFAERADLDDVTELVDQPQPASCRLLSRRPSASGERFVENSTVRDFAQHRVALFPEAQGAVAPAVTHAVRSELLDRERQLAGARHSESGVHGTPRYQASQHAE